MITVETFGQFENKDVKKYTITNKKGTSLSVIEYGAIWCDLIFKGKDLLLGFNSLSDYVAHNPNFGATIGRFANRIKRGTFELNGITYRLAKNNGNNNLHGGIKGFDKVLWNCEIICENNQEKLRMSYLSKDMEEGFPGNLDVTIDYYLTENDEIVMEERATTDADTVCGFTQHAYFNFESQGSTIDNHFISINSDKVVDVDKELIPTGELIDVVGGLDLREGKFMRNFGGHKLIEQNNGYDFCYSIRGDGLRKAATASCGDIKMEVYTTKHGVQLYTANFLNNVKGKATYNIHSGFCLETSGYPDSPNNPQFPSSKLKVGEQLNEKTIFKFI